MCCFCTPELYILPKLNLVHLKQVMGFSKFEGISQFRQMTGFFALCQTPNLRWSWSISKWSSIQRRPDFLFGERSGWVGFWGSGVNLLTFGVWKLRVKDLNTPFVNILSKTTTLRCFFGQLDKLGTVFCLELRGLNVFLFRTWFCRWIQVGSDRESSRFGDGKSTDFLVFEFLKSENILLGGIFIRSWRFGNICAVINQSNSPPQYVFVSWFLGWGWISNPPNILSYIPVRYHSRLDFFQLYAVTKIFKRFASHFSRCFLKFDHS